MICRTTLARSTERIEGWQLDVDRPASVIFHPAPSGSGVVFARGDLPGAPEVTCCLEHVQAGPRWSSLARAGVEVHHTEHILAALAGFGVDDVLVELDGDRIPVVTGGSCAGFTEALAGAGLAQHSDPKTVFRLRRPFELVTALELPAGSSDVLTAQRSVMAVPESGFRATYVFQVPALPGLGAGVAEFDETRDGFREVLSGARTYYLKSEAPELSTLLSQARHDYIVLDNDSPQELVNEVARHKLVDFWGDLRLLGRPVWGSFVALRTGHRFHHELIRGLSDGYLELIELSEGKVQHDNH